MDIKRGALRYNIRVEIRLIFSLIVPLSNVDRSGCICRISNDSKICFLRYCLSRSFAIKCNYDSIICLMTINACTGAFSKRLTHSDTLAAPKVPWALPRGIALSADSAVAVKNIQSAALHISPDNAKMPHKTKR